MASVLNTWLAKEYIDLVGSQEGVVVLGLHGLTVEETQQVRNAIREAGASLRVVKNRIAKTALAEAGIGIDESAWDGSCAILVGDAEATLGASKAIRAMFKGDAAERLRFQGALLDGSLPGPRLPIEYRHDPLPPPPGHHGAIGFPRPAPTANPSAPG